MARIYYSYHNFTDSTGNRLSLAMQTRNYPELFCIVTDKNAVTIHENFIPEERYIDGSRLGYLDIADELLLNTYTQEYISSILVRMGSIFNLYIISDSDIATWIQSHTNVGDKISEYI